MWSLRSYRAVTLALGLSLLSMQPALAAGNLTLPFWIPNPRITSWTDHHYPTREQDGIMIRFDGATGYAYDGHRGTDYAVPSNTPVVAADDGTVIYSEWSDSGGWGVVIDHATDRTAYFHNNQLFVYPGQRVSRGQLIALSGSTGNSTGPHVHFEVRDLLTPWHSIDPYGWTGRGPDPWQWDIGYLWTSNPPVPFLLPLAFFGGARWNYWYGADGPPPSITWQLRDGGHGLAGYAAQWDADPGINAARTQALSGSAAVPSTGTHTLHLRVWDRAGTSADVTYLYLYDVDPPSAALHLDPSRSNAVDLHWSGSDSLSGVRDVSIEVSDGTSGFRPWITQTLDQPSAGERVGGARFLGQPGTNYELRLTVRDAARNGAAPILTSTTVPAKAGSIPTPNDRTILGALPDQPDGSPGAGGLRQEHPSSIGAMAIGTDASLHDLGAIHNLIAASPTSAAPAADVATNGDGLLRMLADGTTWNADGLAGPHFPLNNAVRLLSVVNGGLLAMGSDGSMASAASVRATQAQRAGSLSLGTGVTLIDAGLFPGSNAGLAIDNTGTVHPFGGADAAMTAVSTTWNLPAPAAGIALAGTPQAPAGIITDTSGDWQTFGSLLLLPDASFGGPVFDPTTGLPVR
jgi:Peptidase family M23